MLMLSGEISASSQRGAGIKSGCKGGKLIGAKVPASFMTGGEVKNAVPSGEPCTCATLCKGCCDSLGV